MNKLGRPNKKIDRAFFHIQRNAIPVDVFCAAYEVSLVVLRQHKRFDHFKELGQVRVRQIGRQLHVWRELPNERVD